MWESEFSSATSLPGAQMFPDVSKNSQHLSRWSSKHQIRRRSGLGAYTHYFSGHKKKKKKKLSRGVWGVWSIKLWLIYTRTQPRKLSCSSSVMKKIYEEFHTTEVRHSANTAARGASKTATQPDFTSTHTKLRITRDQPPPNTHVRARAWAFLIPEMLRFFKPL